MKSAFRTLDDANLAGKRVLLRVDLNLPVENGRITDSTRLERIIPTMQEIMAKGGRLILLAHFGRPKGRDEANSLRQIVPAISHALGKQVAFAEDCIGPAAIAAVEAMQNGDALLLENTRFHKGEEKNEPDFVGQLAVLGDIYVNDGFSVAHRAHASTEGLAHVLPSFAGRAMQAELEALSKSLEHPKRPLAAIVGGAKISTKLDLLGNLTRKVDYLIIGGAMANTFLLAREFPVGKSLVEGNMLSTARAITDAAKAAKCEIVLPTDVVVAKEFKPGAPSREAAIGAIAEDDMILDIGPRSVARIEYLLQSVATLVWNGPFGAFEIEPFDRGTNEIARTAAKLTKAGKMLTVAGGGDTVAALNKAGVGDQFSYISTAGGAFLEWLEGKHLPGVEALRS